MSTEDEKTTEGVPEESPLPGAEVFYRYIGMYRLYLRPTLLVTRAAETGEKDDLGLDDEDQAWKRVQLHQEKRGEPSRESTAGRFEVL